MREQAERTREQSEMRNRELERKFNALALNLKSKGFSDNEVASFLAGS
jgi:hypothetical protein